jgi:quercetin dioxygenase-like cupin family protein
MYFYENLNENLRKKRERVFLNTISGDQIQLVYIRLEQGEITDHQHPNEQMGYILSGSVEIIINGESRICSSGDAYCVPSNVQHSFRVLEEKAEYIEIFSPPKDENRALHL